MKKVQVIAILLLCVIAFSCSSNGVKYGDATKDKGSREWGPREIKTTVDTMTTSMYKFLKKDYKKPAFVMMKRFRNRTSDHIDTKMVSDEMVTNLIRKRIRFISEEMTAETLKEIELGMSGLIDPDNAVPIGELKSPNLFLYGEIRENMRTVGNKRVQYLVVTLRLEEVKSRVLVWQERQEFLKTSKKNKITF